jgi:CRISPR-associated protein Cmr4
MNGILMGLLSETSVHPGSGQQDGLLDLPVAREATTEYPVIPGSGLKGALREKLALALGDSNHSIIRQIFGTQEDAGGVGVTDARLLLLPVRSLSGHYRWVTCPYVLERLQRDLAMVHPVPWNRELQLSREQAVTAQKEDEAVFLEEFAYSPHQDENLIREVAARIAPLIYHESVRRRLQEQLIIIHDNEFKHFAKYALPIQTKNQLDDETKTSRNLWNEETLPPDTLMYALLIARPGREDALAKLKEEIGNDPYVQVGGNETTGQGWMVASLLDGVNAS